MPRPIALTIAGSDSSGGAGIQADLKTFSALGIYGATVITALTAQNTRGVDAVLAVEPQFVSAQMTSVFSDLDVKAAKTGMLAKSVLIDVVLAGLEATPDLPLVVDPVMVATSGDRLLDDDAIEAVRSRLLPRATVLTPNLDEAAVLLACAPAGSWAEMEQQGRAIVNLGAPAVLMKGGHLDGDRARDVLVTATAATWFDAPYVDTPHTHGTGCTLSAAIAAGLAGGMPTEAAVSAAKTYLTEALRAGRNLGVGQGHGPVDHLWAIGTS
jgi:hydroxymethylpyrimidine/phosphomethylpyrimidine kinase